MTRTASGTQACLRSAAALGLRACLGRLERSQVQEECYWQSSDLDCLQQPAPIFSHWQTFSLPPPNSLPLTRDSVYHSLNSAMVRASRGRGVLCRGRAAAGSGLLLLTALLSMFGRTNAADDGIQSTPVMGAFLFHAFWFLDSLPPGLCHGRGGTAAGSGDPRTTVTLPHGRVEHVVRDGRKPERGSCARCGGAHGPDWLAGRGLRICESRGRKAPRPRGAACGLSLDLGRSWARWPDNVAQASCRPRHGQWCVAASAVVIASRVRPLAGKLGRCVVGADP